MAYLASDSARKLTPAQVARALQQRFGVSNPVTLDAIETYIHYQLATANYGLTAYSGFGSSGADVVSLYG